MNVINKRIMMNSLKDANNIKKIMNLSSWINKIKKKIVIILLIVPIKLINKLLIIVNKFNAKTRTMTTLLLLKKNMMKKNAKIL